MKIIWFLLNNHCEVAQDKWGVQMGRPKGSKNKPKVSLPTKKKTLNNNNN